jgi:hypothetical protein
MTSSRALEREREDLEGVFADVVASAFGEPAEVVATGTEPDADVVGGAAALLSIHDESDDTYLGVHVRVSPVLARLLAVRLLAREEPSRDDVLEAMAGLGTIAGGALEALLFTAARLSLPSVTLDEVGLPPAREGSAAPTVLRALVLGEVAELALVPHVDAGGFAWPPRSAVLEAQS